MIPDAAPAPGALPGPIAGALDRAVARLLAPVDATRAAALRLAGRVWRAPIARRELRVAVGGAVGVLASFALTVAAPLWLLALGPILLGVPHLLADLRYLVARPGLHRRPGFLPLVALPALATLVEPRLALGLLAVAGALLLAQAPLATRALGAAVALGLAATVAAGGFAIDVAFAHLHNAVALALWWTWRPGRPRLQRLPLVLAAVGATVLLVSGDALVARLGTLGAPARGLDLAALAAVLGPVADPALSLRLVLVFAFAQSVHYGVWLRLLPDDARPRPGLRPFASSYRALLGDCGRPLVLGAAALTAGLVAWALCDLEAARTGYLKMALFHGPLELAAIAVALVERRAPGAAACSTG